MGKNDSEISEATDIDQVINFTPKQLEADNAIDSYKFILYGGAMGGGKSYWLRWELIKLLIYFNSVYGLSNVMVGLFCEDYPSLKDRHISKIKFEFPSWLGTYSSQDHNFVLTSQFGNGVLAFRNLDDVSKYQSAEFAVIGVDELTKNTKETFDFLRTRLRWVGIEETRFLAGTNPGGAGHAWVKDLWINKKFEPNEQEADRFYFIQAKVEDNKHISKEYLKTLDSLPDALRKAFREGDWDIFKGQYFSEWRKDIHTCESFEIPSDWKKFISIDYGYSKPSAVHWYAVDPDGVIFVYRELYETELIYSELAKRIIAMTPESEEIRYWVADPSIWAKKGDELSGAETIQSVYKELKKKSLLLLQGNNERINGWQIVREYLKPFLKENKVTAKLQVFKNCEKFIATVPSLVYDTIRVEDLDTDGEDHCADECRYALMTKPLPAMTSLQLREKLFNAKMKKNKEKIKNPYSLRRGY